MLSDKDAGIYEKIHKKYINLKSYSATVDLTVISNKTKKSYRVKQYMKEPDMMLIEYQDTGAKILIKDGRAFAKFAESQLILDADDDINYLFINEFLRLYYMSQETSLSVLSNSDDAGLTYMGTELTNPTAYRYRLVLAIDNKTLNPVRLSVCDMAGEDVMYADFKDFIYNDKLSDDCFDGFTEEK